MGESDGRSNDQLFSNQRLYWSGRGDLNARPPAPKAGALPGCATPRLYSFYTASGPGCSMLQPPLYQNYFSLGGAVSKLAACFWVSSNLICQPTWSLHFPVP